MREIVKLGLILLVICTIAAFALAMTNASTIEQIIAQRNLANEQARKGVLPDADSFEAINDTDLEQIINNNDKIVEVYAGYKNNSVIGYAIKALPQGYGGAVEVMTGIDIDGNVTGVRIGNHQETPGLGANAALPSFYSQYNGKSAEKEISVVKSPPTQDNEIQAISGATITSDAVTTGVNYAINAYNNILVD